MPDGLEPKELCTMTSIDLEWFRQQLLARQSELEELRELSSGARAPVQLDQSSVGRVSRIDAMQQQAMALATERNRERDLQRVKAAILRLDEGDFGFCVTCGEDIAEKRLRLDPAVTTCIDCAS
ncbi:MAG: TraR/DksA family transcriptional regulator [Hyphomicrobiaceae bacterium]